jgi:hypothetical protein
LARRLSSSAVLPLSGACAMPMPRRPQRLGERACSLHIFAAHDDGEFVVVEAAELGALGQAGLQALGNVL